MEFCTSYYAKIDEIKKKYPDYILVSISGNIPDEIKKLVDIWDRRLAPSWSIFKEYKNSPKGYEREKRYVQRFKKEILLNINLDEIFKDWIDKVGMNKTFVLLCYESNDINSKEGTFCHRRIVQEAIEEKYNKKVPELFLDYEKYKIQDYKIEYKNEIKDEEW